MAKIENSLGVIATMVNQDNIDIVKYVYNYPLLDQGTLPDILNALPTYQVSQIESLWIVVYVWELVVENGQNVLPFLANTARYKIINTGKGIYGVGGIQLSEDNLLLVSNTIITLEDIENNPLTQIYTITDLNGFTVSEYINQLNPAFLFQDVDVAPRLIKITEPGQEADYLFLPPGGLYGQGQLQTVDADFQLLNQDSSINQDNIPTPYIFSLTDIGATSFEDDIPTLLAEYIATLNINVTEIQNITFEVNDILPPEPDYNFDMTSSNWGTIVDAESLANFIGDAPLIEEFSLIDGRIRCIITGGSNQYNFVNKNITEVNIMSVPGALRLFLNVNLLTNFNPIKPLPDTLTDLWIRDNQLSSFNLDFNLPPNLAIINLINNLFTSFDSNIVLPSTMTNLFLNLNQITTAGYAQSENWANLQPNDNAFISFTGNPDSPVGTNFKTILNSKGYNVTY